MKVLSLFSGVGGFDMGLENAGMETVFQCEWDKHANSILHRHWPDVPKWDDVSTLTGKHILANAPVVDVVAWGSPCQDLSVAGKRAGLEGGRSGLFHEGIRIIKELQEESNGQYPRISIWENVVGALNSNGGADFGVILDEMAQAGALVIEWAVLDAQYFGVPQRRRRVFVAAIFDPVLASRCPNPLLPVAESLRGDTKKGKPKRQSAARTLTEGIGTDDAIVNAIGASLYHKSTVVNQDVNSGHLVTEEQPILIDRAAFNQGENALYQPYISDDPISPSLVAQGPHAVFVRSSPSQTCLEPVLFENSRRDAARIAHDGISHTLQTHMGTGGGNVPMLAFDTQFGSNANVTEDVAPTLKSSQQSPSVAYAIQGNVIGRQDHNGPAGKGHTEDGDPMFTLTSTDIHAVASTMAVRRLTPLECERLMGWPDNHTLTKADGTTQADTHRYKQCGNGVASPVAQWIAKHILNI